MKNKIKISNFAIIKTLSALRISKIQNSMAHAKIVAASFARIYGAGTEQEIEKFTEILIDKGLKQGKKFVICKVDARKFDVSLLLENVDFEEIKRAITDNKFEAEFSDGLKNMRFYIKTQYIPENDFVEIEEFAAFSNGDFTKFNLKNKIRISLDSLIIEEALDHPAEKTLKKIAGSFNGKTEIEKKIGGLLKANKEQQEI